jgi:peptidase E
VKPTVLIYSSHNRCNYIHNDWIVQRALDGNKRILFLPMSEGPVDGDEYARQEFSWGNFAWFFRFYEGFGLNAYPFYWNSGLRREDVDRLMHDLWDAEVVILGGGNPITGITRYRELGARFYGEPGCFGRILHERQERGLLTVGYSAGVDQLCEYMSLCIDYPVEDPRGFGLCRNLVAFSHFEHGREDGLHRAAARFPHCLVFGLPNDSGLACNQGILPSGNHWQVIRMIIDNSWDVPSEQFHIKTRQGTLIQHIYPDGRHWAFHGGEALVRIQSPDGSYNESFIFPHDSPILDYWTQQPTGYANIEQILSTH